MNDLVILSILLGIFCITIYMIVQAFRHRPMVLSLKHISLCSVLFALSSIVYIPIFFPSTYYVYGKIISYGFLFCITVLFFLFLFYVFFAGLHIDDEKRKKYFGIAFFAWCALLMVIINWGIIGYIQDDVNQGIYRNDVNI